MKLAWIAGGAAAACVTILFTDYVVACLTTPPDARHIVRPAAEEKRITAARQSRKKRDGIVSWALIASAGLFLIYAPRSKWGGPAGRGPAFQPVQPAKSRLRAKKPGSQNNDLDLTFVDDLVTHTGRGREAAITLLQAIQQHSRYLPDEALRRLCELTEITPAQIAGTSSFYGQFRRRPVGKHIVRVCHGTACHVSGARQITDEVRRHLAIPEGEDTDADRTFTVEEVACLGCCSLAPVLMVDNQTAGRLTPSTAANTLAPFEEKEPA
jgi:NADH:ubiquinone oxidoreductase subunit E